MNIYSKEQVASFDTETYAFIETGVKEHVLTITLDRAAKKMRSIHRWSMKLPLQCSMPIWRKTFG